VRRVSSILAFFVCCSSQAGVMPNINDVPLIYAMLGEHANREACFKAQEAMFIQTGITARYSLVTGYVDGKVNGVAKYLEHGTANVIDEYTPLNSRTVFFIVGTGYVVVVKRQITQGFRNPIFPTVSHGVTVGLDGSVATTLRIPF
jgi:hypothetical protein